MSFGQSTLALINYMLSKKLILLSKIFKTRIEKGENMFNLPNFEKFRDSECYKNFPTKLSEIINGWTFKMQLFLMGINKAEIMSEKVKKVLTEEVIETNY